MSETMRLSVRNAAIQEMLSSEDGIKNFYRFTLAPYDMNLKRLYYQYRWDQKILKGYKKYNEKK